MARWARFKDSSTATQWIQEALCAVQLLRYAQHSNAFGVQRFQPPFSRFKNSGTGAQCSRRHQTLNNERSEVLEYQMPTAD